jgi:hypothetical protein
MLTDAKGISGETAAALAAESIVEARARVSGCLGCSVVVCAELLAPTLPAFWVVCTETVSPKSQNSASRPRCKSRDRLPMLWNDMPG